MPREIRDLPVCTREARQSRLNASFAGLVRRGVRVRQGRAPVGSRRDGLSTESRKASYQNFLVASERSTFRVVGETRDSTCRRAAGFRRPREAVLAPHRRVGRGNPDGTESPGGSRRCIGRVCGGFVLLSIRRPRAWERQSARDQPVQPGRRGGRSRSKRSSAGRPRQSSAENRNVRICHWSPNSRRG
jgi:hypothetical protein